jgi:hypothetical protein
MAAQGYFNVLIGPAPAAGGQCSGRSRTFSHIYVTYHATVFDLTYVTCHVSVNGEVPRMRGSPSRVP